MGLLGLGVVVCEGWPSMGSDFGGVIALMPALVWLVFALSGTRVGWLKLLLVGASAVVAITAISVLDWRRGPDRRSHLGNFVQRVIDGDAIDVVARKAGLGTGASLRQHFRTVVGLSPAAYRRTFRGVPAA